MRRRGTLLVAVLAAALVVAGGVLLVQSRRAGPCDPQRVEPADPRSLQHVLPGASEQAAYARRPPTSGPHQPGELPGGVLRSPIDDALQVGALEAGQVLLQHGPLPPADQARLDALAGGRIVVAPAAAGVLPPGVRVVATAWQVRQECRSVAPGALRRFAERNGGKGFSGDARP